MRRSTLRQLVGSPTFETELELHRLDCLSSNGLMDNHRFVCETRDSFAKEPVLPDPWINGRDLIGLGVKAGPAMGNLLKTAYERQLEGLFPDRGSLLADIACELKPEEN